MTALSSLVADRAPLVVASSLYVLVNAVTFVVFGIDKRRASRGDRRTPERTLHALTLVGAIGAIGAIVTLRHKTKKTSFLVVTALATVVHVALLAGATWVVITFG